MTLALGLSAAALGVSVLSLIFAAASYRRGGARIVVSVQEDLGNFWDGAIVPWRWQDLEIVVSNRGLAPTVVPEVEYIARTLMRRRLTGRMIFRESPYRVEGLGQVLIPFPATSWRPSYAAKFVVLSVKLKLPSGKKTGTRVLVRAAR